MTLVKLSTGDYIRTEQIAHTDTYADDPRGQETLRCNTSAGLFHVHGADIQIIRAALDNEIAWQQWPPPAPVHEVTDAQCDALIAIATECAISINGTRTDWRIAVRRWLASLRELRE